MNDISKKKDFYISCISDSSRFMYIGATAKSMEEISDIVNQIPYMSIKTKEGKVVSIASKLVETTSYRYATGHCEKGKLVPNLYGGESNCFDLTLDTNCIYHCPAREECSCMEVMEDNRCINDHFRAIVDQVCNCK